MHYIFHSFSPGMEIYTICASTQNIYDVGEYENFMHAREVEIMDSRFGAKEGGIRQKDFFWGCRGSGIIIVSIPQKTSSALLRGFAL